MKQKLTALLLALAMIFSICAMSAIAGETPAEDETTLSGEAETSGETAEGLESTENTESEEVSGTKEEVRKPVYLAGPDREPAVDPETGELLEEVTIVPDEVGTVTFANLERRMREKNLQLNAIEENVLIIEDIDYDDLYEDLRKQLNEIAKMQWGLVTIPDAAIAGGMVSGFERDKSLDQLDQAYDATRDAFDSIKDGEMQKDNADIVWKLNSLEDQIVMGGEALYVALAGLEIKEAGLQRQLTALNRTVEEMELRYNMGQISALQLSQVKAGRSSLVSGLETLRMNISNYKLQLEMMIGAEQTGEITLGTLPEVTVEELEKMNPEEDLLTAKTNSYALHEAALTLEDASEDYEDAGGDDYSSPDEYGYKKARHTWNSAQYTYNNTIQEFELKFRTLYAQVQDCYQIWSAALVSLDSEQHSFQAAEMKYQQGSISKNAYLDAQDTLAAAEETVKTAANDLFSMYNTYCWAVQHGILN